MASAADAASDWFIHQQVAENIYWIREQYVCENQCNIWLIRGGRRDVVIDCGFGVCSLRRYLESHSLIDTDGGGRECAVILTHVHFDHSGGAADFSKVYIHEADADALRRGSQVHTLNYVKPSHFSKLPPPGGLTSVCGYRVRPTACVSLRDGERVSLGEREGERSEREGERGERGDYLQVIHTPGHTPGSIMLHYPRANCLFSGDFVYECGHGSALFDWLPDSCVSDYLRSVERVVRWCEQQGECGEQRGECGEQRGECGEQQGECGEQRGECGEREAVSAVSRVYPGHEAPIPVTRMLQLIGQYAESRSGCCCRTCIKCVSGSTHAYFWLGCFRCCPC